MTMPMMRKKTRSVSSLALALNVWIRIFRPVCYRSRNKHTILYCTSFSLLIQRTIRRTLQTYSMVYCLYSYQIKILFRMNVELIHNTVDKNVGTFSSHTNKIRKVKEYKSIDSQRNKRTQNEVRSKAILYSTVK